MATAAVAPAGEDPLMRSYLSYSYALVLRAPKNTDFALHRLVVRALVAEGLDVAILHSTPETEGKIILLVDPDSDALGAFMKDDSNKDSSGGSTADAHSTKRNSLLKREERDAQSDILHNLGMSKLHGMRKIEKLNSRSGTFTALDITAAEEVVLTDRIVRRALGKINRGIDGHITPFLREDDEHTDLETLVSSNFALHDHVWNELFMAKSRAVEVQSCLERLRRILRPQEDLIYLRTQFGDSASLYFCFLWHYTKWLNYLAVVFLCIWLLFRLIVSWRSYVFALSVLGFFVPTIWGPAMVRDWSRENHVHTSSFRKNHVLSAAEYVSNPHLCRRDRKTSYRARQGTRNKLVLVQVIFTVVNIAILTAISIFFIQWYVYGKMAPTCDCCEMMVQALEGVELPKDSRWYRKEALDDEISRSFWKNNLPTSENVLDSTLTGQAVDWGSLWNFYNVSNEVHSRDTDLYVCSKYEYQSEYVMLKFKQTTCATLFSCFTSDSAKVSTFRWVYILMQGIGLGLTLDIGQLNLFNYLTEVVVKLEKYETLQEYQRALIKKLFFFVWINMFFWYLCLAIIFVPMGQDMQEFVFSIAPGMVPGWGWRVGFINVDEMFMTPMLVSSTLNFIIDTFIPLLAVKAAIKAMDLRRAKEHTVERIKQRALQDSKFKASHHVEKFRRASLRMKTAHEIMSHVHTPHLPHLHMPHIHAPSVSFPHPHIPQALRGMGKSPRFGNGRNAPHDNEPPLISEEAQAISGDLSSKELPTLATEAPEDFETTENDAVGMKVGTPMKDPGAAKNASPPSNAAEEVPLGEPSHKAEAVATRGAAAMAVNRKNKAMLLGDSPSERLFALAARTLHYLPFEELDTRLKLLSFSPDPNHYDATEVYVQSLRPEFDTNKDFLDLCMQFGYITVRACPNLSTCPFVTRAIGPPILPMQMFTQAWGLLPICALIRTTFEYRGDTYRLLSGSRRPIQLASVENIGEWQNAFFYSVYLAVGVVAILITFSTGQLDFWHGALVGAIGTDDQVEWLTTVSDDIAHALLGNQSVTLECQFMDPDAETMTRFVDNVENPMTPDDNCGLDTKYRVIFAILLEHIGLVIVVIVTSMIPEFPLEVREKRFEKIKKAVRARNASIHHIKGSTVNTLRAAFDVYARFGAAGRGDSSPRAVESLTKSEFMALLHELSDARPTDPDFETAPTLDQDDMDLLLLVSGHGTDGLVTFGDFVLCLDRAQGDELLNRVLPKIRVLDRAEALVDRGLPIASSRQSAQ